MELPEEITFQDGERIIVQGEPAMEAFLLMAGNAHVLVQKGNENIRIATLTEGDIFGEAALFKGSDYGATVVASGVTTVQPIPPHILDEKIRQCDPMIRALIRMMMVRLRRSNENIGKEQ